MYKLSNKSATNRKSAAIQQQVVQQVNNESKEVVESRLTIDGTMTLITNFKIDMKRFVTK